MFYWEPYNDNEYITESDRGSIFRVAPVNQDDPDGPWTCRAELWNGDVFSPREFRSRQRAEDYAEELELQTEAD